jgi:hypothetical protein
VNTAGSLILMKVSFFNFIIVVVVIGVSTLLFLLLLIINAVSSALPLSLADIMTNCVYPVALYT